jgi:hypothetical protein
LNLFIFLKKKNIVPLIIVFWMLIDQEAADDVMGTSAEHSEVSPELADQITQLWKSTPVQATYKRANEFQIPDCAE